MKLLMLTICLTIPAGNPAATTVDVYPVIGLEVFETTYDGWDAIDRGVSVPYLVLTSNLDDAAHVSHELEHHRQARALTWPGFAAAYAMTAGRAFEDYLNPGGYAWQPPASMTGCRS